MKYGNRYLTIMKQKNTNQIHIQHSQANIYSQLLFRQKWRRKNKRGNKLNRLDVSRYVHSILLLRNTSLPELKSSILTRKIALSRCSWSVGWIVDLIIWCSSAESVPGVRGVVTARRAYWHVLNASFRRQRRLQGFSAKS